jgi:membrane protein YdbS with pleckstrin-like domain
MKEFNGVELHPDEEIKTIFRQYAAKPMAPFTISFLLLVLAFAFFLPLWYMRIWHWNVFLLGRIVFWAMIVFALYVAVRAWIVFRGTMLIVTGERVIDVHRRGIFDRIVSEIPYTSISDVSYRSKGMIEMLANVGTITFQTVGGKENIAFKFLYDPAFTHKTITQLRSIAMSGKPKANDPVEDIMNAAERLSPTEKKALYVSVKKMKPVQRTIEKFNAEEQSEK